MAEDAPNAAVKLFIVSNVRIYREGMATALGGESLLHVLESTGCVADVLQRILVAAPQVIIIDTACAVDPQLVAAVREHLPAAKIIAFGVDDAADEIVAYAEAGYTAFVSRNATFAELVDVVRRAACNELVCSSRIAAALFNRVGTLRIQAAPTTEVLTPRERQVLTLIREGLANKEIADRLGISGATVKNHVHNILEKLHVKRRANAVNIDPSR